MGEFIKQSDVVLLFEQYHAESQNLHTSFKLAGKNYPTVVIDDDGFLPGDVISVYGYFLGDFKHTENSFGRARYFNEIKVPEYWEITGTGVSGKICNMKQERGRIFYAEPLYKRLVKVVDWLDEKGTVRYSDHYNKDGALYARTVFNKKGQKATKSYFSAEEKEVIVENYVTGDIILNDNGAVRIFRNKTAFVKYFLEKTGFDKGRIFINSLSIPFFVSCGLSENGKQDVLFWHEPVGKEIPGNMQMILNGTANRVGKILVQKKLSYDKLIALGADARIVGKLGYVYPFERENHGGREALICTNSDQIEKCREIIEAIPEMHFHIAALTEMSSKLLAIGNYKNVTVYPSVNMNLLEQLFKTCDWYLDINHGIEIVSAVRKAFLQNQLIFAFNETLHQTEFVAESHCYPIQKADEMIRLIKSIFGDKEEIEKHLQLQREAAMTEAQLSLRCI